MFSSVFVTQCATTDSSRSHAIGSLEAGSATRAASISRMSPASFRELAARDPYAPMRGKGLVTAPWQREFNFKRAKRARKSRKSQKKGNFESEKNRFLLPMKRALLVS